MDPAGKVQRNTGMGLALGLWGLGLLLPVEAFGWWVEGGTLLLSGAAAILMFRRAGSRAGESMGWRWIGAALLLRAFPSLLRVFQVAGLPVEELGPGASLAHLILTSGILGRGLLAWPLAPASWGERFRKALDGLLFAGASFFLFWALALQRLVGASFLPGMAKVSVLAFFVMHTSLLGVAIFLGARAPSRFRGPLGWVALGEALALAGNLVWAGLAFQGKYHLGHPVDGLILLICASFVMAPLSPHPVGGPAPDELHETSKLGQVMPYLPLAGVLALGGGLLGWVPEAWDRVMMAIALILGAALLLRQFLALRDLQRLSLGLEARVAERTRALESAQALLLRTERMNTVASLGAGLAHDLKNWLGVVRNFSLLVAQDLDQGQPLNRGDLEAIQQASDQAGRLASRLMAYGQEDSEVERFDAEDRLSKVADLLRPTVTAPQRFDYQPLGTPLPLIGSPAQFDQVVVNLVLNAREALQGAGTIRLSAARVSLPEGVPAAQVQVADDGCGMGPETLARLFEPFFTTKPKGVGTGLGLTSVKGIVEGFGGALQVDSTLGVGTTFTLRIPLAPSPPGASEAASPGPA